MPRTEGCSDGRRLRLRPHNFESEFFVMGTWGPGNFENDTAADHVSILTGKLIEEIERAISNPRDIEPDEYWGVAVPCNLELLCLIGEQGLVGCLLPDPKKIEQWKATYMSAWESKIDNLDPKPDHRRRRKKVLTDTFDRLMHLAQKNEA